MSAPTMASIVADVAADKAADTITRLEAERDEAKLHHLEALKVFNATNIRAFAAEAEVVRLREALQLARSICHDAFKDTCMEWDAESMAIIDGAILAAEGRRI